MASAVVDRCGGEVEPVGTLTETHPARHTVTALYADDRLDLRPVSILKRAPAGRYDSTGRAEARAEFYDWYRAISV